MNIYLLCSRYKLCIVSCSQKPSSMNACPFQLQQQHYLKE